MSEKTKLIKEMLEMQKKFIAYEHKDGVDPKDYYAPESGHILDGYRQKYNDIATKLIDIAHEEKGSHR